MKWTIRLATKRNRKYAKRLKANSIEDLVKKLSRHAKNLYDFDIETPVGDPAYWKALILQKLFQETHSEDKTPTLF